MKMTYETPKMFVEDFMANNAVAACSANTDVTFDCMAGPQTDTANVLASTLGKSCTYDAGFIGDSTGATTGTYTAVNSAGNYSYNHSKHCGFSWSNQSASIKASGLLYICSYDVTSGQGRNKTTTTYKNTNHWSASGTTATHTTYENNSEHTMIAPVYGEADSIATSW